MNGNNITLANENKFTAANYSEALTAFTVGWTDPDNIQNLLDFIAPPIPVGRRFEFKRSDNAESFYSESDDVRAIGSEFKRVRYNGSSVNEKTINKGLTMRIDHDEVVGDDWQERYTQMLLQRLLRNELRRAISAMETIAVSDGDIIWDETGTNLCNPDADIRSMLNAAANHSGVRPNRLLFGESAWAARATALENQATSVAFRASGLTPAELAGKFLVEGCEVVSARYQSGASVKDQIVGNKVFAFYGRSGISKDEPSNLKRFYTPMEEGSAFRVYCEEHAKYTDITVEHYSSIVAASELGARCLNVSAQ